MPTAGADSSGAGDSAGSADSTESEGVSCDEIGFASQSIELQLGAALEDELPGPAFLAEHLVDMDGDGTLEAFVEGDIYTLSGEVIDWDGAIEYVSSEDLLIDFDGDGDVDRLNLANNTLQLASGWELAAPAAVNLPSEFVEKVNIFVLPEPGRTASLTWRFPGALLFPQIQEGPQTVTSALVALVDLTGDGRVDLLTASGHAGNTSDTWQVYENVDGTSLSSTSVPWEVEGDFDEYDAATSMWTHGFAHLDNDGLLDLVCENCGAGTPGQLSTFLNTGSGFAEAGVLPAPSGDVNSSLMSEACGPVDIDGDGDIDMFDNTGVFERDGDWTLWRNEDGSFSRPIRWNMPPLNGGFEFFNLSLFDIDGDGVQDLLATGFETNVYYPGCVDR